MSEKFFILTPTATNRTAPNSQGVPFPVYLDAEGHELKWSGKMAVPAIGARVYLAINSIGYGRVEGYAASHGWLALLVRPEDPPDWYRKQVEDRNKENQAALKLTEVGRHHEGVRTWPKWILEGIACIFGAEIREQQEVKDEQL